MFKKKVIKAILIAIFVNLFAVITVKAESSPYELTCRNKAKEIAADTYKNCVTEQRESQLQQIRSEYKTKLADLKSYYDKELKKLSSASSENSKSTDSPKLILKAQPNTSKLQRKSGARNLPRKTVKTQVIDFTSPAAESNPSEDESLQSQNRLKSDTDNPSDVEIVELPPQE